MKVCPECSKQSFYPWVMNPKTWECLCCGHIENNEEPLFSQEELDEGI